MAVASHYSMFVRWDNTRGSDSASKCVRDCPLRLNWVRFLRPARLLFSLLPLYDFCRDLV
jgi:hypothetical protein